MTDTKQVTDHKDTKKQKFSPAWTAAVNFIFGGIGYLYLHEYNRFFIFYAVGFVASFIGIPFSNLIILTFIAYDAYQLTKKVNEKGKRPPYNQTKLIIAVVLILATIALSIWAAVEGY